MPLSRRQFLASTLGTATAVAAGGLITPRRRFGSVFADTRPNILVVMTDDQRADTVAGMPWLGQAVASWTTYPNYVTTTPLCCPNRAAFLKGTPPSVNGVLADTYAAAMDDSETVATRLHHTGYSTWFVGKYLNDFPWPGITASYVPPGWDQFLEISNVAPHTYVTDALFDQANAFLTTAPAPWFGMLCLSSPHLPARPAPQDVNASVSVPPPEPSVNEADVSDKPPPIRYLPLLDQSALDAAAAARVNQARSLLEVDRRLAQLIPTLPTRTVIAFTSDNALCFGEHRVAHTDDLSHIGAKGFAYEEAIRVPLHVSWPSQPVPTTDTRQAATVDLTSTVLAIAGAAPLTGATGTSLTASPGPGPWSRMESPALDPTVTTWEAVRSVDTKYVVWRGPNWLGFEELYDLAGDPYELQNQVSNPLFADRLTAARAALAASRP
jgi:arylsulfatase A-like enzyme